MSSNKTIVQNGESLAMNELLNKAGIQNRKYRHTIPVYAELTATGTAGSQTQVSIQIAGEGDFYALRFAAGLASTVGGTKRGVSMQVRETGYGKQLFRDFVDMSLLASPGWGTNFYPMIDFEQLFLSNSDIIFEFKNNTAGAITIDAALHGWQFLGSARGLISGYAG